MSIEFVTFGIVIDDIVLYEGQPFLGILGGGGPQTAFGMATALGGGDSVGMVAVVGSDCTPEVLAPLTRYGINLDGVRRIDRLTPRAWQRFDAHGNRSHVWQVPPQSGNETYTLPAQSLPASYQGARAFHWGLHPENPSTEFSQRLLSEGKTISVETFRPPTEPFTPAMLRELVTACTIFTPSWGEAVAMTGVEDELALALQFRAAGCQVLSLRMGEHGALIFDFRGGTIAGVRVPSVPTTLVDPTGAGNAFAGAFIARLDEGITTAGAAGVAAASYMLEQYGIPTALPLRADFEERMTYALERIVPVHSP